MVEAPPGVAAWPAVGRLVAGRGLSICGILDVKKGRDVGTR